MLSPPNGYSVSLFTHYTEDRIGKVWRKVRSDDTNAPNCRRSTTP